MSMSTSRLTKWTKNVLTSLLVSLVTCSLMIGAKSRGSALTSKADYQVFENDVWRDYRPIGSQFSQLDNYTIYCQFSFEAWANPPFTGGNMNAVQFNGSTTNPLQHQELEFSVVVYRYGTSTIQFESDWYPTNSRVAIAAEWVPGGGGRVNTYRVYVRRADGSELNRLSMNPSVVYVFGNRTRVISEQTQQTLPSNWFGTTTEAVPTYTTATKPAEYDSLVGTVPALAPGVGGDPPSWFDRFNPINKDWFIDVLSSLDGFFDVVSIIASRFQFVWVIAGFVIVGCLLAWLLH